MLIRTPKGWTLPESAATPESTYLDRRRFLKGLAAGPLLAAASSAFAWFAGTVQPPPEAADPSAGLYPVARNDRYRAERPLTAEAYVARYNNFYEFGSHKEIYRAAQKLPLRPWTVAVDGLVEKPFVIDIDDLLRKMPLEERVYRHRCVEAWAMTVPWSGFAMAAFVDICRPLGAAKYVAMQTFHDPDVASGQREFWYPWPYTEGLTLAEATNELAFLATGLYGKPLPKQNGAPLRLVVPWKYGFKSVKSIVRVTFTEKRPKTFWETVQPNEYGFWANVNPDVPHPRWSQATERLLGEEGRVPTRLYNGYGEFVVALYTGLKGEKFYR